MNKKIRKYLLFLSISFIILLIAGCSDKPYQQSLKVETNPEQSIQQETKESQPESIVKTFNVGETATDGRLKFTVNSISFKDKVTQTTSTTINGQDYSSDFDIKPKEGYQFLLVDVTVENLQKDKTSTISSILQFKVTDADGYDYNQEIVASAALDKSFKGGDLLPGSKSRGIVAFEVPKASIGLKFNFLFEIGGQTAVFDLQ